MPDQLLPWLLGPFGLTVGLLYALWKFSRGEWQDTKGSDERWQERLDEWKARYADEHAARVASEQRLSAILPAMSAFTTLAASIRDELRRVRPPAR